MEGKEGNIQPSAVTKEKFPFGLKHEHTLPDSVIDTGTKANILLPQMYVAQTAITGTKITELILNKQLTWKEYDKTDLTSDQIDTIRQASMRAHGAYDVKKMEIPHYAIHKVVISEPRKNITAAANHFAEWAVKGKLSSSRTESRAKRKLREKFFDDPQYRHQAEALAQIWQAAASALDTDEAKSISKTYRESIRSYLSGNKTPDEGRENWEETRRQIGEVMKRGINFQLETIKNELQVDVPPEVVNLFIEDMKAHPD
jgi:hypothetical protein